MLVGTYLFVPKWRLLTAPETIEWGKPGADVSLWTWNKPGIQPLNIQAGWLVYKRTEEEEGWQ